MATPAQNTAMRLVASGAGAGAPAEPVPVAFVGRTSTLELQDPRASLRRQLRASRAWLPPGWFIAAYYWDIESGGLDLEQRSQGDAYRQFTDAGIPRTAAWPTCSPRPPAPTRNSPPSSARTSSGPAATPSTR